MKHLLNTLFVTSEDIYLSLDGENVVANRDKQEAARYPLHTLSGIVSFSYSGASEKPYFSAFRERADKVDNLNSCFEDFSRG